MNREAIDGIKTILDQAPCGMGLFRSQGEIRTLYLNRAYFALTGYTQEEYAARFKNPLELIIPENLPIAEQNKAAVLANKPLAYSVYRIKNKQGELLWIKLNASLVELAGEQVVFASFTDVTKERRAQVEKSMEEERYRLVMEQTGSAVFEWNFLTGSFYCSPSYRCYAMSNIEPADILKNQSPLDVVHPDDLPVLMQFFADSKSGQAKAEAVMRIKLTDGTFRWSRLVGLFFKNRVIGAIIDIHAEREKSGILASILNAVPGGVGLYRLDEKFSPVFFNDRVAALCGMTRAEYEAEIQDGANRVIHPEDFPGLLQEAVQALQEKRTAVYTYRLRQKQGGYRWTHLSGDWMPNEHGCPVLCAVFTDVNDQRLAAQALKESEMKYQMAVKAAGMNIWEYDIKNDCLVVLSNSPRIKQGCFEIKDYTQSTIQNDFVREDSREAFLNVFRQLRAGVKEVSADLWYKTNDTLGYWCEHVIYTNVFDADGTPVKAFGVGRDITREKDAEQRYRHELAYREVMQKATVASLNMNLTQNKILDFKSKFEEIAERMQGAVSAQAYFETVYAQIPAGEMRAKCRETLDVNRLLKRFALGETSVSLELTRNLGGKAYWTVLNVYMMKNHESNDIVAFLYSTDITNEKVMQNMMDTIVRVDYDYLVVVDAIRDSATRYSENCTNVAYADESQNFEAETREYISRYVCAEDAELILKDFTLKNIIEQLDQNQSYSLFYSVKAADGQRRRKQLRFNYINPEYKVFLMTRVDITAVYEEKEKQNEKLAAALHLAEQASATKSEFLSRMSHEIRTPMNAIIGMAEIAAGNVENSAFVLECIEKSQEASRYLLSLLNDILDMSRIESGKTVLTQQVFTMQTLFDSINTMVQTQAARERIRYVFASDTSVAPAYLGDETRIKQILINLLNNAVKFTKEGGTVTLSVRQTKEQGGKATLECMVADTGIGISPAFLPTLFEPFAQEHNDTTASYGGSGLGLSIARNLARLMGGDITAESRPAEGTRFTVRLELGVVRAGADSVRIEEERQSRVFDFAGKAILLFEDHPLNTMVAKTLLEGKGFTVTHAKNGKIGVEQFVQSAPGTFDAILMDIRMPIMDGLQAASAIRALERLDAKEIPIIAMTANAYADDVEKSRQAGMNAHLAKPIEPQKLYETLQNLMRASNRRS